ncbi:MAG: TonB-dependent receptor [Bacteroidia bacterium]
MDFFNRIHVKWISGFASFKSASAKILILCFIFLFLKSNLSGQNNEFNIKVLSTKDSSQLAYATVSVNSSNQQNKNNQHFNTDVGGNVKFNAAPPFKLTVYKFGYKMKETEISSNAPSVFYLDPLEIMLDPANVSTAQLNEKPVEQSLYKVKVISSREIQLQAATNLRDILNNQLNMQVNTDPILGSSINMQGLSGQNIKILIDGVPVIGRENGNIDLSQINLSNISHIEVVEGPVSTVYGADALGGVINLISKNNTDNPLQVDLNSKYESIGTYNFDGAINFNKAANSISLYGGRNFFDGYSPDGETRDQLWNPREQYFGGLGYIYRFKSAQLRYKGDFLSEKIYDYGTPVITPYEAYSFDNVYETKRLTNSLFYTQKFGVKSKINANASYQTYQRTKLDYYKNMVTLENSLLNNNNEDDNATTFNAANIKADYSNFRFKKLNYQAGFDFNFENGSGAKIPGKQSISDYAVFASAEWTALKALQIRPAFRIADNSSYGIHFIPAINLKYTFKSNSFIRLSVASGYRSPSLKELYLDFVDVNHNIRGNPNLNPENSINYQLSIEHTHFFTSSLIKFEPSVFYNDIQNTITLALNDAQTNYYTYINSGSYKNYGFGISGTFQSNAIKFDAGFFNTATYNLLSQYYDLQSYLSTPEYRLALTYTNNRYNLSSGIFFKHVGETKAFALDDNSQPYLTQSDPFSFLDWTVSKKFYQALTITTGIKNILNVKNVSSTIVSGAPHSGAGDLPVGTGTYFVAEVKLQLFKGCFKTIK